VLASRAAADFRVAQPDAILSQDGESAVAFAMDRWQGLDSARSTAAQVGPGPHATSALFARRRNRTHAWRNRMAASGLSFDGRRTTYSVGRRRNDICRDVFRGLPTIARVTIFDHGPF